MKTLKQKLLLFAKVICVVLATAIVVTAYGDDGGSNDNDLSPPFDPNYSLKGTWYEVGSTDAKGIKVIFTETNVTMFDYGNYLYPGIFFNDDTTIWYDNLLYSILSDDTLQIYDFPMILNENHIIKIHKTPFVFENDTLSIEYFLDSFFSAIYPWCLSPITLIRRCQNEN